MKYIRNTPFYKKCFLLFAFLRIASVCHGSAFWVNAEGDPYSVEKLAFASNKVILKNISLDASVLRPEKVWTVNSKKVYFGQF